MIQEKLPPQNKSYEGLGYLVFFCVLLFICIIFLIWFFVPHCHYESKYTKIELPHWTQWTYGTTYEGKIIYCDDWIIKYQFSKTIFNFDIYRDGICITKKWEKVCK